ncbi:MAG: hypothetical protein ACK551_01145 [Vampirovibrionales bacterium]
MKLKAPPLYASPSLSPSKRSNTQREGVTVFKEVAHIPQETWEAAVQRIVDTYDKEFIRGISVSNMYRASRRGYKSIYGIEPENPYFPFRFRIREKGRTGLDVNNYQLLAYPKNMLTYPLTSKLEEMGIIETHISKHLLNTLSIDKKQVLHTPTTLDTLFTTMRNSSEDPYTDKKNEWLF